MSEQEQPPEYAGKMVVGGDGIGTVSPDMVKRRAAELAKIDGRTEPNEGDLYNARGELLGLEQNVSPEVADDPELEQITGWDEPLEATGSQAPKILPADDMDIAESLVQQGIDEADHDQRLTSAEENPPEEE